MDSKKSTLSRRELFGRLTGRSRSEASAERSPDQHPSTLRADELLRAGDYQKASELYARLTLREPDFLEAYRKQGWCYLKLAKTAEARQVLEKLLEQQPEDATALLYIALSHAMDGSAENAVTVLRDVHDYNRIVVQREVNLIQFLTDSAEMPSAEDLVERIERVIAEQNRMPGTVGVYF
ncbi:tetratricopeptide repeat protein [Wenzhouxiangella limi]|uniref:Tetratricopeptide repeat protein n=1 Tax=Wenzhouxiangella limi TaxID=2707351 RepID=A0A845UW95_9GAMM|nr:tetratricopeptide repeat protein [Wenzhouxiangella limi]NDY95717.1 tetratricopeptide repeat protein [Wenzhouxiangella limi]